MNSLNREIAQQLEAIQFDEGRRPIMTPDDFGVFLRDDAISRVVSQVRRMEECEENLSGEGGTTTGNNYKFEIERTDSLEFTRNSETVEPFDDDILQENEQDDLAMLSSDRNSGRRNTVSKMQQIDRMRLLREQ